MCKFWFGVNFPFNLRCSSQKWNRQFLHLSLIVVLLFILCYHECFVSHSSVLSTTKLNATPKGSKSKMDNSHSGFELMLPFSFSTDSFN